MSDLVARLRSYHPCIVRLGDAGLAGLADDVLGAADLIESLQDDVRIWKSEAADRSQGMIDLNLDRAAMGVENARLREALASLHNDMTGAFGRIEAVADAVASDMRRTMREALSGRVLAGEGCDG